MAKCLTVAVEASSSQFTFFNGRLDMMSDGESGVCKINSNGEVMLKAQQPSFSSIHKHDLIR